MPLGPSAGSKAFFPFFSVSCDETTFHVPTSLCLTSAALDCAHPALLNRHAITTRAIFRMARTIPRCFMIVHPKDLHPQGAVSVSPATSQWETCTNLI